MRWPGATRSPASLQVLLEPSQRRTRSPGHAPQLTLIDGFAIDQRPAGAAPSSSSKRLAAGHLVRQHHAGVQSVVHDELRQRLRLAAEDEVVQLNGGKERGNLAVFANVDRHLSLDGEVRKRRGVETRSGTTELALEQDGVNRAAETELPFDLRTRAPDLVACDLSPSSTLRRETSACTR